MQHINSPGDASLLMTPFHNQSGDQTADQTALPANPPATNSPDYQMGLMLSAVLRYGVLLSCAIVFVGGILYLARHGAEPVNYRVFQGEPAVFCSPKGILEAVLEGRRRGLVQLGLLVLVATPMVRVVVAWLTFVKLRDRLYIALTSLVLAGLIYSFLGAYL